MFKEQFEIKSKESKKLGSSPFSYMHRWEVEQAFRFCKSELAMESTRLWFWQNRLKLMAIVLVTAQMELESLATLLPQEVVP